MNRLLAAFAAYVLLGLAAWKTIDDRRILAATCAVLAMFALKTLLHRRNREPERSDGRE